MGCVQRKNQYATDTIPAYVQFSKQTSLHGVTSHNSWINSTIAVRSSNGTFATSYILHANGRTNKSGYKSQIPIISIMAKLSPPNKKPLLHQALIYSIKSWLVHVAPHTVVRIHGGSGRGGDYKNKTAHCLKSGHYIIQRQYWWAVKFRSTANRAVL